MKDKSIKPPPGKPDRLPPRLFIALSPSLAAQVERTVKEFDKPRPEVLKDLAIQSRSGIAYAMEELRSRYGMERRGGKRS